MIFTETGDLLLIYSASGVVVDSVDSFFRMTDRL